jgi:NhaA family Na+:H+ antiporter
MAGEAERNWLDRPVDPRTDHVLGPPDAEIALVEYGSYACAHCSAANQRLVDIRDQFGDRLRYVFRHRPLRGNALARRAAELAELALSPKQFWKVHSALMSRSSDLTEEDLADIATQFDLPLDEASNAGAAGRNIEADIASADASGVIVTPAFFINGRRYDGPWDDASFTEALSRPLAHRVRVAALDFVNWPPSSGLLLLLAAVLAVVLSNSALAPEFSAFWNQQAGVAWGSYRFGMPLLKWVNDGLLSIFFLVVGLEIKRELTVGHLSTRQLAAMPLAAAIGGMAVPAGLYLLLIPAGPWASGWGVPIATDTAFAIAVIAVMGQRVPIELRIFLTAAAIADDVAVVGIIAFFYTDNLDLTYLVIALGIVGLLVALNRLAVYRVAPYALLGVMLWICIYQGGVHATLAGVILAFLIPTRPPPDYPALIAQADALVAAETQREDQELRHPLSTHSLRALEAIHNRLESPAARVLRIVEIRSSYAVLPIFALANAGVALRPGLLDQRGWLAVAIIGGLFVGKPLGMFVASLLAVKLRLAKKPDDYSWLQVAGAGALAGIGFTMSLFIAGEAYPALADFDAAKIAIFTASLMSAIVGFAILWWAGSRPDQSEAAHVGRLPKAPTGEHGDRRSEWPNTSS